MRAPLQAEHLCRLTSARRLLSAVWRPVPVKDGIWDLAPGLCAGMAQGKGLPCSTPWEKRPTAARYGTGEAEPGTNLREQMSSPRVQ